MRSDRRTLEWWIAVVRLAAVPFAILQVALIKHYPPGYERAAWILTAILAVGAVALYASLRHGYTVWFRIVAMVFDFTIISAFTIAFTFEAGTPSRELLFLAIVAGAARFGIEGGLGVAVAAVPVAAFFEDRRAHFFHVHYRLEFVTFQAGAGLLMALAVGWLYERLDEQRTTALQRASEAELLRDELGRRADLLDAANRCARALSSSLDLDEAFSAFIREVRGLVSFDRMAIVLSEDGVARVIATAGELGDEVYPAGTQLELEESLLAAVAAGGQTIYRADMSSPKYVEEARLVELGLRSRIAAPLLVGARVTGLISFGRREVDGFDDHEIEPVNRKLQTYIQSMSRKRKIWDSKTQISS